ncbi:MAG: hypothetical protein H7Z16_18810 [Pyrinomonadaceae bacterium]|nr:hypothetical protein [Pyrinomonadaceae bacterium]
MNVFHSFLLPDLLRSLRPWLLIAVAGFLAASFVIEASAQSGRRNTGQPTVSPSPPPPSAAETARVEAATSAGTLQLQVKVKLLFARQPTSKRLLNEDVISASFFKRLTDFINVDCTSIGDLKQAQARARAKSERDAFVVLLKFDMNNYQSGTIVLNSPDLEIEYFAFAPRTGKKHVNGKIYFQTIGGGRMQKSGWPNGTPIRITPEAAGIEAAETLHHLLLVKNLIKQRRDR